MAIPIRQPRLEDKTLLAAHVTLDNLERPKHSECVSGELCVLLVHAKLAT